MLKIFLFLFSLAIIGVLVYLSDPTKLLGYLSKVDLSTIFILLVISLLALFIRVYRLQFLLSKKYKISYRSLFPIYMYGLALSNIIPGRVSEPVRALLLKIIDKIPLSFSLGAVFLERLSDMIVILLFSLLAFYFVNASVFIIPFAVILASILIVIFTSQHPLTKQGVFIILDTLKMGKHKKIFSTLLTEVKVSKAFIYPLAMSFAVWLIDGYMFYFALQAVGAEVNFFAVLGFFTLSLIVGLVSFLPGGLGSFEAAMALLLSYTGTEYSLALAGVILARLFFVWLVVLGGVLSSLAIKQENLKEMQKQSMSFLNHGKNSKNSSKKNKR